MALPRPRPAPPCIVCACTSRATSPSVGRSRSDLTRATEATVCVRAWWDAAEAASDRQLHHRVARPPPPTRAAHKQQQAQRGSAAWSPSFGPCRWRAVSPGTHRAGRFFSSRGDPPPGAEGGATYLTRKSQRTQQRAAPRSAGRVRITVVNWYHVNADIGAEKPICLT